MTVVNASSTRLRFRRSGATWLAAILTFVFVLPVTGGVFVELSGLTRALWAPVVIIAQALPVMFAVWSLRSGVDVSETGLTIKALIGSRRLTWSQVRGFDSDGRTVFGVLDTDARLALPSVRRVDLPQLIAASGQELRADETPPDDTDEDQ
ncbi:MAG: PH domain-containing protein [Stackebrandtia sp.]